MYYERIERGILDYLLIAPHEDGKGSRIYFKYAVEGREGFVVDRNEVWGISPAKSLEVLEGGGNWKLCKECEIERAKSPDMDIFKLDRIKNKHYAHVIITMEEDEDAYWKDTVTERYLGGIKGGTLRVPIISQEHWDKVVSGDVQNLKNAFLISKDSVVNPADIKTVIWEKWNPVWLGILRSFISWFEG